MVSIGGTIPRCIITVCSSFTAILLQILEGYCPSQTITTIATTRGSNTENNLRDNMSDTNPVLPDAPLDVREQLRQHFSVPYTQHNDRWHNLWEKGEFLPFDRGQPNPALIDTLTDRHTLVGKPVISHNGKTRKRALVPGCGRGYDVLLLAAFGYDAYGLEVSESAVKACNEFAEKEFAQYTTKGSEYGCGLVKFILGDFFKTDWFEELRLPAGGFDLIYDYTVGRPYESQYPLHADVVTVPVCSSACASTGLGFAYQ